MKEASSAGLASGSKMNNRNSTGDILSVATAVKPAAIWARVSTTSQAETSLPSQVSRCKEKLEQAGYTPIHIFSVDFSSMDLYSSTQFQELRRLIQSGDIQALAVYDRDRLSAQGLQRLLFLSEIKDSGVELIICEGAPIIDGPEGQIVELALAIGKERQVLRARQGSRDGLHDRATIHKKPVTYHKLYGYQWDKLNNRLVPNGNYDNVKLIFDLVLNGNGYSKVITELKKRVIPSPSGNPEWNKTALTNIIHNPVYAGRYFALKKQAIAPKERHGATYGNSSVRKIPLTEATYIPEIEILNPPITWEQRGHILEQLEIHQKLASRNAKRDYLLRGRIFCETHRGKNGEPRRYHGRPKRNTYYYACPVGGCRYPYINGPVVERWAKGVIGTILFKQPDSYYKRISGAENKQKLEQSLKTEIRQLEQKYSTSLLSEAMLEDRFHKSEIDAEVYPILKAKYHMEKQGLRVRQDELLDRLAQIGREKEVIESIEKIKSRIIRNIAFDQLQDSECRKLFEALNIQIHVKTGGQAEIVQCRKKGRTTEIIGVPLELYFGVPISKQAVNIASANPEPG